MSVVFITGPARGIGAELGPGGVAVFVPKSLGGRTFGEHSVESKPR